MEHEDRSYQDLNEVEPMYLSIYNTFREHENEEPEECDANLGKPPEVAPRPPPQPTKSSRSLSPEREEADANESNPPRVPPRPPSQPTKLSRRLPEPEGADANVGVTPRPPNTTPVSAILKCVLGCVFSVAVVGVVVLIVTRVSARSTRKYNLFISLLQECVFICRSFYLHFICIHIMFNMVIFRSYYMIGLV